MNQSELSKEQGVWIGSLAMLVLLALFPFTAHKEGIFVVLQQGNFSVTFWSKFGEMPLLLIFPVLLLINAGLAFIRPGHRQKSFILLVSNFVGLLVFVVQFTALRPDVPLGPGAFLLFFALLLFFSRALSRLDWSWGIPSSPAQF